jgi:hypothetical protein
MARQRYSKKEAINRFLRYWIGQAVPSDEPDSLSGEILSEDEAWSDIAEAFGNSLPNQTPTIPDSVKASAAEAIRNLHIYRHDNRCYWHYSDKDHWRISE